MSRSGDWNPVEGDELASLLERKLDDAAARQALATSSRDILSRCADPADPAPTREAGLVVGYVQSGKTLSFTSVAAMAKDNGYAMVIVIAGTSQYLLGQSERRLLADLDVGGRGSRGWVHVSGLSNRRAASEHVAPLQSVLDAWRDPEYDVRDRRTALVTVMKHHGNLRHLTTLIGALTLPEAPVLVIDDEADQASLDNNASDARKTNPTTTYQRIAGLRACLPRHTFLQYTATPQANLLIEIADALSPSFVRVLEPGGAYVGGRELFVDNPQRHLRALDAHELDTATDAGEPPSSLHDALRCFLVGLAADYVAGRHRDGRSNRSMLVHPSRLVADHGQSADWVRHARSQWLEVLREGDEDERQACLAAFRASYDDLVRTVPDLPAFEDVMGRMRQALTDLQVREINQGAPPVDWGANYAYVLVGGQAIERGFTVEGLTVTYMPRGPGGGQADTIQQRGRFFGYKRSYIGMIRIWLAPDVQDAFRLYVEHEEDMRRRLRAVSGSARPLQEWRRGFLLDPSLRPTRRTVLARSIKQSRLSDEWLTLDRPATLQQHLVANRELAALIRASHSFQPDTGHSERTNTQRHLVCDNVRLDQMARYLAELATDGGDNDALYGAILQVDDYLERNGDGASTCIYLMGPEGGGRSRTLRNGKVPQLFQGGHPRSDGPIYRGDREAKRADLLTLQVHMLNLDVEESEGTVLQMVPTFALWVPQAYARGTAVREGG